jgi:hypothetical protein
MVFKKILNTENVVLVPKNGKYSSLIAYYKTQQDAKRN